MYYLTSCVQVERSLFSQYTAALSVLVVVEIAVVAYVYVEKDSVCHSYTEDNFISFYSLYIYI